jgi:hypothetical protein
MPATATIHVHVVDDLTGQLLADVDAHSVDEGLAYYLASQRIEFARRPVALDDDVALAAHVEGSEATCEGCRRARVPERDGAPAGAGASLPSLTTDAVGAGRDREREHGEVVMTTEDAEGRQRKAVYLPEECWDWLEAVAERDGTSRSDLLEGLVLLAMDEASERAR